MASYRLDPDGTVSNAWAIVGVATAHAALKGTAVNPAAGETAGRVSETTAGDICEVSVDDLTLGTGESVSQLTLNVYGDVNGSAGRYKAAIYTGTTLLSSEVTINSTAGWYTATYTGSVTQTELNDLRIRLTDTVGNITAVRAHEAYIQVTTVTAVSQTFTGKYDILNTVSQTFTEKYDILNTVSQTFTEKWDILSTSAVSQTFTGKYDVLNSVVQTFTGKYDIDNQVAQTFTEKWDILATVSQTFTGKYDITNQVVQTFTGKYDVLNMVSQTFTELYDIGIVVAITSEIAQWHGRNLGIVAGSVHTHASHDA